MVRVAPASGGKGSGFFRAQKVLTTESHVPRSKQPRATCGPAVYPAPPPGPKSPFPGPSRDPGCVGRPAPAPSVAVEYRRGACSSDGGPAGPMGHLQPCSYQGPPCLWLVAPRGGVGCLSQWLWDSGGVGGGGADGRSPHMAETQNKNKKDTLVWDVSHPLSPWLGPGSLKGPFGEEPSPHSDKLPFLISAPSPRRARSEPPNKGVRCDPPGGLWVPQGIAVGPANERP